MKQRQPQPDDRWIYISLPGYTGAVVVNADGAGVRVVVDAAPVMKWAIGKPERFVADYFRRRHAVIIPLSN